MKHLLPDPVQIEQPAPAVPTAPAFIVDRIEQERPARPARPIVLGLPCQQWWYDSKPLSGAGYWAKKQPLERTLRVIYGPGWLGRNARAALTCGIYLGFGSTLAIQTYVIVRGGEPYPLVLFAVAYATVRALMWAVHRYETRQEREWERGIAGARKARKPC